MAKRPATDDLQEVVTGEIRRAVKRLHTGDEPRPEYGANGTGVDPALLCGGAAAAFAEAALRQPYVADAHTAPRLASDFSSPSAAAHWKFRSVESSQRTPESPTRPPLASEDSEGPESSSQYADVNQLLRALHFERLMRLQSRSPQPPPPDGAQQDRRDASQ